ncbi:Ig kappa chain V region 2717 [Merluccius polli]|uniref:Ig kappa chain V region 2717 n=1 Tax=Merluccius polli TaxID=89951 RepID=A0AA47P9H0_MERPO|nr:Ig kappa chain V region 2717 [Merluccius polli]
MSTNPDIIQDKTIITASVGDSATFQCIYEDPNVVYVFWYRQKLGDRPCIISSALAFATKCKLHNEFENDPRFLVELRTGVNHLTIQHLQLSDSATYYCGTSDIQNIEYRHGTFLHVKGSEVRKQAVIHQGWTQALMPGDSVNLTCEVHAAELCSGDHSIYWYRPIRSQPALIYANVDLCKIHSEVGSPPLKNCSFHLPMANLGSADAGTYYCVLSLCGDILFGNGTKVEIVDDGDAVKLCSSESQKDGLISCNIGETVTFQCLLEDSESVKFYLYWQMLRQNLRMISTHYSSTNTTFFHQEFEGNPRYSWRSQKGAINWTISDLQPSDSGSYFCASSYSFDFKFFEGLFLSIKTPGATIQAVVNPEGLQHRDTWTVSCEVKTANCHEEQRVYWFRSSTESQPGVLYGTGVGDNRCERDPENQTRTCVYHLPREGVNRSQLDTETFYCAVVSCGVILFGSGTDERKNERPESLHLVYAMGAALALTTILVVILASALYKMNKRISSQVLGLLSFHSVTLLPFVPRAETQKASIMPPSE